MKTFLLCAFLCFSVWANTQTPVLIGKWGCVDGRSRWELNIKDNGKYKMDIYTGDIKEWFKGSWRIDPKNKLILSIENVDKYACYDINEIAKKPGASTLVPYLMFGEKRFVKKKQQTLTRIK